MLYLGIDQHHKQITISLRDEEGSVIQRRQVSTRPEKTRAFLDELRRRSGEGGFVAVLEVCGFNDWLIALLEEYGCREIVLIHPDKRSKRKTDRRDAGKLRELLWLNGERLREGKKPQGLRRVVIPTADDQQDRQLTALRKRVGQQRTRTINKIKNILRRHNLTWEQPTKTFQTKKVKRWLRERSPQGKTQEERRGQFFDDNFAMTGKGWLHRSVAGKGGGLPQRRFSPRWLVDSGAAGPLHGTTLP